MQTLETMQRRIGNAEDLHAVVRMMKALAAVSINQYESAVESLVEFNRTIEMGFQCVLRTPDAEMSAAPAREERNALIVFGSDQGMCGSFNEQIAATVEPQKKHEALLVIGARIAARLEDVGHKITALFHVPNSVAGITPVVNEVLLKIDDLRFTHGIDRFWMIHHLTSSDTISRPLKRQLLPIDADWLDELRRRPWPTKMLPQFTMDRGKLFAMLIRQYLFVGLYRAFAESLASENANRLASMQAAERNIQEHLDELIMAYHQKRQQSITEELLDIISGFETLHDGETGR